MSGDGKQLGSECSERIGREDVWEVVAGMLGWEFVNLHRAHASRLTRRRYDRPSNQARPSACRALRRRRLDEHKTASQRAWVKPVKAQSAVVARATSRTLAQAPPQLRPNQYVVERARRALGGSAWESPSTRRRTVQRLDYPEVERHDFAAVQIGHLVSRPLRGLQHVRALRESRLSIQRRGRKKKP
jgi:hypothetical protein